jgi:hypothetical protein
MARRTSSTEVTADTTLVTTAETVIATLSDVGNGRPGGTVRFRGEAKITTGTATTAVTLRVRRDSVSGTVVDESNAVTVEAAAGSTEDHDIQCDDTPSGEIAGATYVLTAQQTSASANGSVVYAYLAADMD